MIQILRFYEQIIANHKQTKAGQSGTSRKQNEVFLISSSFLIFIRANLGSIENNLPRTKSPWLMKQTHDSRTHLTHKTKELTLTWSYKIENTKTAMQSPEITYE